MKYFTYMAEVQNDGKITIPAEIKDKLDLNPGDKAEITVRKLRKRRLDIFISQNPLHKLMKLSEEQE